MTRAETQEKGNEMIRRKAYSGFRKRLSIYRIGKEEAGKLLSKGWELWQGPVAYELVDPRGFARYWLARKAAKELKATETETEQV